jgi:hypothetical protein
VTRLEVDSKPHRKNEWKDLDRHVSTIFASVFKETGLKVRSVA